MEMSNLIIIPLLGGMIVSSGEQHQKNKPIVYTWEDLRNIGGNMCYDRCYRKLSGQTVKIVRNLRINKKKKKGSKAGSSKIIDQHRPVNLSNLIRINSDELSGNGANQKTISWQVDFNNLITIYIDNRPKMDIANDLSLMLANVQSIKSKT